MKREYDKGYDPEEVRNTESEYQHYLKKRPFFFLNFAYLNAFLLVSPFVFSACIGAAYFVSDTFSVSSFAFVNNYGFLFLKEERNYIVKYAVGFHGIDIAFLIFDITLTIDLIIVVYTVLCAIISVRVVNLFWIRFSHRAVFSGKKEQSRRSLFAIELFFVIVGFFEFTNLNMQLNTSELNWLITAHPIYYIMLQSFVLSCCFIFTSHICVWSAVVVYRMYHKRGHTAIITPKNRDR